MTLLLRVDTTHDYYVYYMMLSVYASYNQLIVDNIFIMFCSVNGLSFSRACILF